MGNERRFGLRLAVAAVTIALWLVSVFYHEEGGKIFARYFDYGATHWGGGSPAVAPIVTALVPADASWAGKVVEVGLDGAPAFEAPLAASSNTAALVTADLNKAPRFAGVLVADEVSGYVRLRSLETGDDKTLKVRMPALAAAFGADGLVSGVTPAFKSPRGRATAERLIFGVALVLGVLVLAITLWSVLRSAHGRRAFPELLLRGAVGLLACWAANRYWICIQSEDVHFAQYGFVAFGLSLATGSPRAGFALAVFCGFLDESNQWWRMYFHEVKEHLDWSDMCLNTCGACCGALPWTAIARLRRYAEAKEDAFEAGKRLPALLGVLGIAAIVVFLKTCCTLGHDQIWPYWDQLDSHKPFHQYTQREGIPGLLALACVLYYVCDERRKGIPIGAVVFALVAWHLGVTLPSDEGAPIHENVPRATVPRATGPITIDGKLDEKDWERALRVTLGPFEPDPDADDRKKMPQAFGDPLETKARLLWDDNALYVAFECASKDVWAWDLPRDHGKIANGPCVEVFLDTDNAERTYYEFEVSAANRQADYFCYIPEIPQWVPVPTSREFVNLVGWDSKFKSAVTVQGELDLVPAEDPAETPRQKPPAQGYTVEMAIPWHDMQGRSVTPDFFPESPLKVGAKFRVNLYRVETYRPQTRKKAGTDTIELVPGTYMAWSPPHAPLDFHRPQFFAQITLGD